MVVTVYTVKGGAGKTSIAFNLANELKYNLIENDGFGGVVDMMNNVSVQIKGLTIKDQDEEIPLVKNTVYDFGGFRDPRTNKIIERSDVVIIPTLHSFSDIKATISTVIRIRQLNLNAQILVSINRVGTGSKKIIGDEIFFKDFLSTKVEIDKILSKIGQEAVNFICIRENKIWAKSTSKGKSIKQLTEASNLLKHNAKGALEDLSALVRVIKTFEKGDKEQC